jgi:catalase (peroxidase I)
MYGFRHDTSWITSASQAIGSLLADTSFDFGSAAPRLIRLAAHVAMSYDPADSARPGGSQRSTIGEPPENGYGEHNGLQDVVGRLASIHAQHPESTISDIYILAGNLAIEHLGGPALGAGFCPGRDDAPTPVSALPII